MKTNDFKYGMNASEIKEFKSECIKLALQTGNPNLKSTDNVIEDAKKIYDYLVEHIDEDYFIKPSATP